MNPEGPVVLVTGGAQGIGRELCRRFADTGARVLIADRNVERARSVADELEGSGALARGLEVDVAVEESVAELVSSGLQAFGRIDVLVNNAALFSSLKMRPFDEIPLDEWNEVIAVNLSGVFICCQRIGKVMKEQGSGAIINMSSATVLSGRPNYLHYVTAKSGLVGLTRALAREVGEFGVRVNAVMPGSVETEVPRETVSAEQAQAIVAGQAIPRRLNPTDIAGATIFLASDAAGGISGQTLVVDGGSHFV